jgi:hypothetical protein
LDYSRKRDKRGNFIDWFDSCVTRDRAVFVALIFVPVTVLAEIIGIWSQPELLWRFPLGHDFVAFWAAARAYAEGGLPALYNLPGFAAIQDTVSVRPGLLLWHYPPFYLLLILPLAGLPFWSGWAVFQAGGLTAFAIVARRIVPTSGLLGWAAVFGAPVIAVTLVQGQNGAWFAAALIGGVAAIEQGRKWLAALLFAFLLAKPQIGLLVPVILLAQRDYRSLGLTALAGAGFILITTATLGVEAWRAFFANTGALADALTDPALLAQMPTVYATLSLAGVPHAAALAFQAIVALIVVVTIWRLWSDPSCRPDLRLAAVLFAVLLVPPYGFRYDMVTALAGACLLARDATTHGWLRGERAGIALLWLWPAAFPALALITGAQTGAGLLFLGLWLVWRRVRQSVAENSSAIAKD